MHTKKPEETMLARDNIDSHCKPRQMVKCEFGVVEGKFLGHVVKAGEGVMADPKKVAAIVHMQRPRTIADIRTLLGACSYLRRFIADFSDVTLPMRLIQKNYRNKTCEVLDEDWLPEHAYTPYQDCIFISRLTRDNRNQSSSHKDAIRVTH